MTVRLNKWIADSGLCSRREADRLIESGQVTVNGQKVTAMGVQIEPKTDKVRVRGRSLPRRQKVYVLFHKPKGVITTRSDEKNRKTIYDVLPKKYQACDPAGRLDRDSSGALILTNDGDFIHRITHPKYQLEKIYRVKVEGELTEKVIEGLCEGVRLEPEGKMARAKHVDWLDRQTLKMTLVTGYNRQIRRMLASFGHHVTQLRRISIGPVALNDLSPGRTRALTLKELKLLAPKDN